MYQATTATNKIYQLRKRIRAVAGGTSASKTISILLVLIDYAQKNKDKTISIVSESIPHLKRGVIRDFINIMREHNYYDEDRYNKTDRIYYFETGSVIEFFSVDDQSKVRGPRRDILFVNEANNILFDTYTQLEIRTREAVYLDWNPTNEFWFYTDIANQDNVDFVTLTYLDNESLDPAIRESIERKKGNKSWWRVYGLGLLGEVEGRVYSHWDIIPEIPHEARLIRYGLDFGYTNDPTAIVGVYLYNGGYIFDEVLYRQGMLNRQIADHLLNVPYALTICDSAEPKSIDELRVYGVDCKGCTKKPGSITQGIQYIQAQRCSVTARSTNIIKEYRNYMWDKDRDGRAINEPIGFYNHAMDAIRYAFDGRMVDTDTALITNYSSTRWKI